MPYDGPYWQLGRQGEQVVKRWLQEQGFFVVPTADISNGGAPILEGLHQDIVLPDLLASMLAHSRWVEVKTKSRSTYHQQTRRQEHGIETRLWDAYRACQQCTGIQGWLCIYEIASRMVMLQTFDKLRLCARYYDGTAMPGRQPHVFFPRDRFEWYPGPTTIPVTALPAPIPAVSPRTLAQPVAPDGRQMDLFDRTMP